jgi:hypothetical protein
MEQRHHRLEQWIIGSSLPNQPWGWRFNWNSKDCSWKGGVEKRGSLLASSVDETSPRMASTADTSDDACNGTATSMNSGEEKRYLQMQIELPSKRSRSKKEVIRSCSSKSNRHGKRIYLCSSEGCANQAIQVQGRVCIRHMLNTHSSFSAYLWFAPISVFSTQYHKTWRYRSSPQWEECV